jgi:hypothetical protein
MPRKKVAEAHAEQKAKGSARIRYLIRNPVFQEEFNELRKLVAQEDDIGAQLDRMRKFEDRWAVPFLVRYPKLFQKRDDTLLSADTISKFESMVTADVRPARLLNDVDSFRDASRLYICVDLNCDRTVESLCALIEEEVRRAFRERQGNALRSRTREDKIDFYLKVFDRAERGDKFVTMSRELKKRLSTIKSAFLAARRNVFGSNAASSKEDLPRANFDPVKHCQQCSQCQKATRFEDVY